MALRSSAHPTRRPRRLAAGIVGIAATALLLVSGCSVLNGSNGSSSDSSSSGSGNLEKTTITVAAQPFVDAAPLYIAKEKGYFKQEGLNVKIHTIVSGSQSVPDVNSGVEDIGQSNWATLFAAQAQHLNNFKIVADSSEGQAGTMELTTYPGSGI